MFGQASQDFKCCRRAPPVPGCPNSSRNYATPRAALEDLCGFGCRLPAPWYLDGSAPPLVGIRPGPAALWTGVTAAGAPGSLRSGCEGKQQSPRSRARIQFSKAARVGTGRNDWKTNPLWSRRSRVRAASLTVVPSCGPTPACPKHGASRPTRPCIRVDLPEPEGTHNSCKHPPFELHGNPC